MQISAKKEAKYASTTIERWDVITHPGPDLNGGLFNPTEMLVTIVYNLPYWGNRFCCNNVISDHIDEHFL